MILIRREFLKNIINSIALIGLLLTIPACMGPINPDAPTAYVRNSAYQQKLISQLQDRGVQIYQVGDDIKIALPTDYFFLRSGEINPRMTPVLAAVADLVKTYASRPVKVIGHTDEVGSDRLLTDKSQSYAQQIAAYLWAQNIPLQVITIRGEADNQPIASNMTVNGSAANRRVDIVVG